MSYNTPETAQALTGATVSQELLDNARAIIDNGYPPGVLMIDDNWQEDYGTWEFSPRRFKDAARAIGKGVSSVAMAVPASARPARDLLQYTSR